VILDDGSRPAQQDARANVCAIGISDRYHFPGGDVITLRCGDHKICQLIGAPFQILHVEHTFRQATEKPGIHAGQLADLVVLEGDPTKNVGALGKCASS
jgi:hypothetical protein